MNNYWNNVLEQYKAKEILTNFFESRRVPHAFIFNGTDGIGKFFTALQFAQILYSQYSNDIRESAFKKIRNLQEPYIKIIFPLPRAKGETADDSSIDKLSAEQIELIQKEIEKKIENPYHKIFIEDANTIKINSIREIKKFISYSYDQVPLRFIFILDADLMNEQTQNALLKSLEEPPEGIIFFIITAHIDKLLPTIQSRCWIINFQPLSENAVAQILINNFKLDKDISIRAAHFSDGSVQNALHLIEKDLDFLLEKIISILRFSLARRYYSAYQDLISVFEINSHDEFKIVIRLIKIWLNDVIKNRFQYDNYYFVKYRETLEKFNQKFMNANVEELYDKLEILEEGCDKNLNLNVLLLNLIFELASVSLRK